MLCYAMLAHLPHASAHALPSVSPLLLATLISAILFSFVMCPDCCFALDLGVYLRVYGYFCIATNGQRWHADWRHCVRYLRSDLLSCLSPDMQRRSACCVLFSSHTQLF